MGCSSRRSDVVNAERWRGGRTATTAAGRVLLLNRQERSGHRLRRPGSPGWNDTDRSRADTVAAVTAAGRETAATLLLLFLLVLIIRIPPDG